MLRGSKSNRQREQELLKNQLKLSPQSQGKEQNSRSMYETNQRLKQNIDEDELPMPEPESHDQVLDDALSENEMMVMSVPLTKQNEESSTINGLPPHLTRDKLKKNDQLKTSRMDAYIKNVDANQNGDQVSPPESVRFSNKENINQELQNILQETAQKFKSLNYIQNSREKQLDIKQIKKSKWQQFKEDFYGYTLILWDGLGFFGTDHMKLGRLKGEKVNFCTPFKSPRTMILSLFLMTLALVIFINEFQKLYTQKSSTISLVLNEEFSYHFKDALALHSGNWFYVDKVFKHIQDHQIRNRKEGVAESEKQKLREYRNIPLTWKEMDWHDKRFIEEYLCNRTNMYYRQSNYYDAIGSEAFEEQYTFTFKCELLDIANDKIRVHYWIPVQDENFKATFENSLGTGYEPKENLTTIFFKRSSEFQAHVYCDFDKDLDGLYSYYTLFHTKIGNNLTAYNNWNFSSDTSSKWWDSVEYGFWFAKTTTILVNSQKYQIGAQQLQNAYIRLQPERFNHIQENQTSHFLGMPITFEDRIDDHVIWKKTVIMDDFGKTPIRSPQDKTGAQIISNIDFDFTERIYDVRYYGILDIFAKLGGLRASILPILGYFMPLLTLHFLYSLAVIIDDKLHEHQMNEMVNLIKNARQQFRMIQLSFEQGQIELNREQRSQLDECLKIDFSNLVTYKCHGQIDIEKSKLDEIEDAAIQYIVFAQSIQEATDRRLKEKFISRAYIENCENDHDSWTHDFTKEQDQKMKEQIKSGIITMDQAVAQIEKEIIADHMLQYMIEPVLICEERFKYYTKQRNLSRLQVLGSIRSRISFYSISNLFDKVEMKDNESKITQNIQQRHSFRLQQIEKTIERMHRMIDLQMNQKKSKNHLQAIADAADTRKDSIINDGSKLTSNNDNLAQKSVQDISTSNQPYLDKTNAVEKPTIQNGPDTEKSKYPPENVEPQKQPTFNDMQNDHKAIELEFSDNTAEMKQVNGGSHGKQQSNGNKDQGS